MGDNPDFAGAFGPWKMIHLQEPKVGLKAELVVDNVAAVLSIGGLRTAADVSARECSRLARALHVHVRSVLR